MSGKDAATKSSDTISRFKKDRYLLMLSEDDFRDQIVRPLFLRLNLGDGRDLCGPNEAGKDALFVNADPFGLPEIYLVQTKKGTLNETRSNKQNIVEAITQLRTALEMSVTLLRTKTKHLPSKVFLCASGEINDAAKRHIVDEVRDPRLNFLDRNELIPLIDQHCPEIWLSLEAELLPYFRALVKNVDSSSESFSVAGAMPGDGGVTAATDKAFVPLKLYRITSRPKRRRGVVEQEPHVEELPVTGLPTRRERAVLILGEAGSGKSTSLRRIAYMLARRGLEVEGDYKVPVVLRATDVLRRAQSSLVEAAAEETKRLANSSKAAFSKKDLAEGRVVTLIDALDEVTTEDGKRTIISLIHDLQAAYPRCQVVVTSREYGFVKTLKELEGFTQFRVMPIDFKQAEQILERVSRTTQLPQENAKELLRRLQQVHGMDLNPLLVTVFAATSDYARKDIPANITELFKKFTEMMLGRWDQTKGLGQQYHAPLKDFVLRRVAFEMHRKRVAALDLAEFKAVVESELQRRGHRANVDELLDEIVNRSGLFRIIGNSVEFTHLLLQEFFAGRGIPSADLLDAFIGDEWWQRAIVFYFGEHPDDAVGLTKLASALRSRPARDVYAASLTLGLALQACYLVEVPQKVAAFVEVILGLSSSRQEFLHANAMSDKYPLSQFLGYYLFGREAVACDLTNDHFDDIQKRLAEDGLFGDEQELRDFWLIVGLIEAGHMDRAEKLIKGYKPSDTRLSLALFTGCFLMRHMRVVSKEQERLAERSCSYLGERITHLRKQLLDEIRSELLEIRQGKVTVLELPQAEERKALPEPS